MAYDLTLPDGTTIKVVPESDLMAVKSGAEKYAGEHKEQLAGLQTQVTELTTAKDEAHTALVEAQAAKTQLEEQLKEGTVTKTQVDELQTKLTTAEGSVSTLKTAVLDLKKANIVAVHGVSLETLQDKTKEQLESLEEALKIVGSKATKPATVDVAGGGTGTPEPKTAVEKAAAQLAAYKEKYHQTS